MKKWFFGIITIFIFLTTSLNSYKAQDLETTPLYQCRKLERVSIAKYASDNVYKLYYYTEDGTLEATNLNDGKTIWKTDLGGEIISEILYDEDRLYLVTKKIVQEDTKKEDTKKKEDKKQKTEDKISIEAISVQTGLPIWQKNVDLTTANPINLFNIDSKLYLLSLSGEILILDKIQGNIENQLNIGANLSSNPVVSNKNIYLATDEKSFNNFSVETGKITNEFNLTESAKIIATGNDERIFIGDVLGTVYAYNLSNKKLLWKTRTGAEVTDIKEHDKNLFISSNDNFIYSISSSSGNIIWKKKLAGRNETSLFENKEKNLLFTTTINTDVFTVTSIKKGKTVNQMFLQNDDFFVGGPILLKNYIVVPTNTGFNIYSLNNCKADSE